jgi:hypothetical protein
MVKSAAATRRRVLTFGDRCRPFVACTGVYLALLRRRDSESSGLHSLKTWSSSEPRSVNVVARSELLLYGDQAASKSSAWLQRLRALEL